MTIKAILFDIDGTLVDSNDLHVMAWQQAFAEIGATFDRARLHDQMGKGTDMLVPSLLPDLDEAGQHDLGARHGAIFKERYLHCVTPFPRVGDLLTHVARQGQAIVLASSAARAELDYYVDLLGVGDLVTATTSSDDADRTKPAPDIFAAALKKLPGIDPGEAMVVGDTPYDLQAAHRCGVASTAVLSGGFDKATLRDAGAQAIYRDVAALLDDYGHSPLRVG